jgi:long-chain acyl-CoA synthetase
VPTDVALLQLTGGTTRHPKAVALTHRNLVANVVQLDSCVRAPDVDNGAVMCLLPFFHIFGFEICLQLSVFKGYHMVLVARFDPTSLLPTLQLVDKYRPISFPAVPALWAALTKHAGEYESALRHIAVPSSGGAPLDPAVQRAFEQLTGRRIAVAYGLSEAPATHLTPLGKPLRPGSIGIPLPDTDARIVDVETGTQPLPANEVGELVVRGPQVMQAYWHADEAAESSMRLRDGWLYTGDLARMDEDGFFYVVDRKDDLIITSGFNVCPSDVEALLRQHPAVQDVAVVGIPDSVRGQSITAVVVLSEGHSVTNEDLLLHCREHLPAHQVPRAIERVAEIPKSPVGKPLRRVLRQQRAPK